MRKNCGFTLFELLISLTISSFIILGVTQNFQSIQKILLRTRMKLQINKEVTLFFNQIERDFTTAFIPTLHKKPEPEKKKGVNKVKEIKKENKETPTVFFIAKTHGEETATRVGEKKYELFKEVSMVNTNPLQVWGEKRSRLVRVGYQLVKNKKKSTKDITVFDLIRKETSNLHNTKFEKKDDDKVKKSIRTHIVATNIKHLFVSYIFVKAKKEKKEKDKVEATTKKQVLELMTWGLGKETINSIPRQVLIQVTFHDNLHNNLHRLRQNKTKTFKCMIPIFSYPAPARKKKQEKPKPKKQPRAEP